MHMPPRIVVTPFATWVHLYFTGLGKCDGQFEATDDAGMFSNRVLVVEHHRCESGSGGVRDGTTKNWLVVKARAIR